MTRRARRAIRGAHARDSFVRPPRQHGEHADSTVVCSADTADTRTVADTAGTTAGATVTEPAETFPVTVTCGYGEVESHPERIVVPSTSSTETVFAVGAVDQVVVTHPINSGWIDVDVGDTIRNGPELANIICTGREAADAPIEVADTVSEVGDIEHADRAGARANEGIEF